MCKCNGLNIVISYNYEYMNLYILSVHCVYVWVCDRARACVCACVRTCMRVYAYVHVSMRACVSACVRASIRAHVC